MKTLEELREEFESRDEIARHLKGGYIQRSECVYVLRSDFKGSKDHLMYGVHRMNEGWVNGAW